MKLFTTRDYKTYHTMPSPFFFFTNCPSLSIPVTLWVEHRDVNKTKWDESILQILSNFKVLDHLIHFKFQCVQIQSNDETSLF